MSSSDDLLLFLGILLGLCFLTFFPSFQITKVNIQTTNHLVSRSTYKPGELIVVSGQLGFENLKLGDQLFSNFQDKDLNYAVVGVYGPPNKYVTGEKPTDNFILSGFFTFPEKNFYRQPIQVKKAPLNSGNKLRLPASVIRKLNSAEDSKKQLDRNKLKSSISSHMPLERRFCWDLPVKSKITSHFGRPRTLPSGKSYYHSGVDLRAFTGTPIHSAAEGYVVFANHMTVPGNNVVISHGGGLFSRYMHLSEIEVTAGQRIPAGTIIGKAGATGRVEAPHLHWEVIWNGQNADPIVFLDQWNKLCDEKS